MKIDIHRPEGLPVRLHYRPQLSPPVNKQYTEVRFSPTKYLLIALLLAGIFYAATTLSLTTLLIIGGVTAAVFALLVAVCVWAQNNVPAGL